MPSVYYLWLQRRCLEKSPHLLKYQVTSYYVILDTLGEVQQNYNKIKVYTGRCSIQNSIDCFRGVIAAFSWQAAIHTYAMTSHNVISPSKI